MRKRTEEKRQSILQAASAVFQEMGFERASMSDICARVGGSKATLYNYFPSKEALFLEVLLLSTEEQFTATHDALSSDTQDVASALCIFGERFLAFLYSPKIMAARRLMIAESGMSELGQRCYEKGPLRSKKLISSFLKAAMDSGQLRPAPTELAADHLKALLESELLERFMFKTLSPPSLDEIHKITHRAVSIFMAAYGPSTLKN